MGGEDTNLTRVEESGDKLRPDDFIVASDKVSINSLHLLKELYDLTKTAERDASLLKKVLPSTSSTLTTKTQEKKNRKKKTLFSRTEIPLESLITDGFGEDQIWEEIQLQNGLLYDTLVSSVAKVLSHKPKQKEESEEEEDEDEEAILKEFEEGDEDLSDDDDFFESDEKYRKKKSKEIRQNYPKSIVDDKFFNLHQMTEYVDKLDAEAEKDQEEKSDDEDDIDLFEGDEEEAETEEADDYYYKDFFDPPLDAQEDKPRYQDDEDYLEAEGDNDDEEETEEIKEELAPSYDDADATPPEKLSTFEKRKRKTEENIQALEDEALKPKAWHLTGEVTAQTRPENSLLEEHLVYDHLLRQAPEITMKTTQKLEDIIKQRIKDKAWDDVIRKIKPIEHIAEYKKRLVLDAEKSKMSLTEIYEKEFIEKEEGKEASAAPTSVFEEDKDPEEHKTIKAGMQVLFAKLDALSHFNYTPKAPVPEIKTIRNTGATSVEEITPSTYSDAMLLAPQEILQPSKGEVKGKEERSATDRKRERRLKKKKQHLKRLSQEEKARSQGLGLRNIKLAESVVKKAWKKKKGEEEEGTEKPRHSKELKSSTAFFAKLQEQAKTHIDKVSKRKGGKEDPKKVSVKRLKL